MSEVQQLIKVGIVTQGKNSYSKDPVQTETATSKKMPRICQLKIQRTSIGNIRRTEIYNSYSPFVQTGYSQSPNNFAPEIPRLSGESRRCDMKLRNSLITASSGVVSNKTMIRRETTTPQRSEIFVPRCLHRSRVDEAAVCHDSLNVIGGYPYVSQNSSRYTDT